MIAKIIAALATALTLHPAPYHLSGPVRLYPHRTVYETVRVDGIPRSAHDVIVYAAHGQDESFARASWSPGHKDWIAKLPFVNSDQTGTWYITSTVWSDKGEHQIGAPRSASFTVNRSAFVR